MIVDVTENSIAINFVQQELKPYQLRQIAFWGFRKHSEGNLYVLNTEKVQSLIEKLAGYLEEEGVRYSLSPAAEAIVSRSTEEKEAFQLVKSLGKGFKEGNYETEKYVEFGNFIRANIPRKLKQHQLKAAYHLWLVGNGANFSVPGSGKTAVVLAAYEKLKSERKVNFLFVVGPPACFGPWKTEFQETLKRNPSPIILAGGEKQSRKNEYYKVPPNTTELYLSTFQTVLNDNEELQFFLNQREAKAFLVIDEAHYIKQVSGSWAESLLNVANCARVRCVLTGTPMPRSYSDVFNLFDFLWGENKPIDSTTKLRITGAEERNELPIAKSLLEERIGPFFYRVRKSDLGLTHPLFHPPHIISMNKNERTLYFAIENRIRSYSKDDYLRNIDLVNKLRRGRIMRLRQCSVYAKLLASVLEDYDESLVDAGSDLQHIIQDYDELETPAKLLYLTDLLRQFSKSREKVVIWSNFVGSLELISEHLSENGFYNKLIYGKTPIEQTLTKDEEDRESIRDEFVDPKSGLDILIANPAACGESVSLHKTCHNAIYYDLSYNCAQYLQSLDRIHRVGGSEITVANYHFLQYENTIDQDIGINLTRKAQKMYDIIDEDYAVYSLGMFEEDKDDLSAYERLFGR